MMTCFSAGRWILMAFLFLCVFQDVRTHTISLKILLSMFSLEIIWYVWAFFSGQKTDFFSILVGFGIGVCLFALSRLSDGTFGDGDACFFAVYGLASGIQATFLVLSVSLFLAGIFSLVLLVRSFFCGASIRHKRIPLLPFIAVPAVFLFLIQSGFLKPGGVL